MIKLSDKWRKISATGLRSPLQHPMTLVEVLLATFILSLGLVGILSLVPVTIRQAGKAMQNIEAASVAQNARRSIKRAHTHLEDSGTDFSDNETWGLAETFIIPGFLDNGNNYVEEGLLKAEEDPVAPYYSWLATVKPLDEGFFPQGYYSVVIRVFYPRPQSNTGDVTEESEEDDELISDKDWDEEVGMEGAEILITAGKGAGQSRKIKGVKGGSPETLIVTSDWDEKPDKTSKYLILRKKREVYRKRFVMER